MQVKQVIVGGIEVNVMDDLSLGCTRQFPVFPLSATPAAIPVAFRIKRLAVVAISFLYSRPSWLSGRHLGNWTYHFVAAPHVSAVGHARDLLVVRVERVAVASEHLVVAHAKVASRYWPLAVRTRSPDNLTAPSIIGSAVPLNALVVHQAEAVRRVLPPATLHAAYSVKSLGWHGFPYIKRLPIIRHRGLLRNVMRWIGRRIEIVEGIPE